MRNGNLLLLYFIIYNLVAILLRWRAEKYLKEEYRPKISFHRMIYMSNEKFQNKKGIILRNTSNGITVIGMIIFIILLINQS